MSGSSFVFFNLPSSMLYNSLSKLKPLKISGLPTEEKNMGDPNERDLFSQAQYLLIVAVCADLL